jgi:hypothetical protein
MGIAVKEKTFRVAATLIPSVGCPMGCNFCATSSMFGGKGKWIDFYRTGDELFDVMCRIEQSLGCRSFFVMDENFLSIATGLLRLLERFGARQVINAITLHSADVSNLHHEHSSPWASSWIWMEWRARKPVCEARQERHV